MKIVLKYTVKYCLTPAKIFTVTIQSWFSKYKLSTIKPGKKTQIFCLANCNSIMAIITSIFKSVWNPLA